MELQRLTTKFDADVSGLQSASVQVDLYFTQAEKRASDSVSHFDRISKDIGKTIGTGIKVGLGDISAGVDSLINITEKGLQGIPVIGMAASAAFKESAGAMREAINEGFAYDDMLKRSRITLGLVAGGANDATKELAGLRYIASNSEFGLPALVASAEQLQIMQGNAHNVVPEIQAIANAASALGRGEGGLNAIVNALARINEMEKVDTRAVRQLINAGIPAFDIIGEAAGKSSQRAKRLIDTGRISVDTFTDAILGYFQKRYPEAAAQMAQTMEVQNAKLATGMAALKGVAFQNDYDETLQGITGLNAAIRGPEAGKIAAGFNAAPGVVMDYTRKAIAALRSGDVLAGAQAVGDNIIEGLKQGIANKASDAYSTVTGLAQSVIGAFAGHEGIDAQSPSKKFEELGHFAAEGFGIGFTNGMGEATKGVIASVGAMLDATYNATGRGRRGSVSPVQPNPNERDFSPELKEPKAIDAARRTLRKLQELGATEAQIQAAFAAIFNESGFNPDAIGDARTAYGLFQQHSSYGSRDARLNVESAVAGFLREAMRVDPTGRYGPGDLAANVERPAPQNRYKYGANLPESNRYLSYIRGLEGSGPVPVTVTNLPALALGHTPPGGDQEGFAKLRPEDQLRVIRSLLSGGFGYSPGDLQGGVGELTSPPSSVDWSGVDFSKLDATLWGKNRLNPSLNIDLNQPQPSPSIVPLPALDSAAPMRELAMTTALVAAQLDGVTNKQHEAFGAKAQRELRGWRGELLQLGLDSKTVGDSFENNFISAFDHVGEAGHNFGRDLALGIVQDLKHNIGTYLAGEFRDDIFGSADGKKKGLLGSLGKLLGIGGDKSGAATTGEAAHEAAQNNYTTATQLNTTAEQRLTFSVDRLTAAVSRAGLAGGARDAAPNPFQSDDTQNGINDISTNTHEAVQSLGDVHGDLLGIDREIYNHGFSTVNAIHDLKQTLQSLIPPPLSFGKQLLLSFVGALGGAIGGGLTRESGNDTSDEGPDTGRPTSPPVLKHQLGGTINPGEWGIAGDINGRGGELVYGGSSGVSVFNNDDSRRMLAHLYDFSHTTNSNVTNQGGNTYHIHIHTSAPPASMSRGNYVTPRAGERELANHIVGLLKRTGHF